MTFRAGVWDMVILISFMTTHAERSSLYSPRMLLVASNATGFLMAFIRVESCQLIVAAFAIGDRQSFHWFRMARGTFHVAHGRLFADAVATCALFRRSKARSVASIAQLLGMLTQQGQRMPGNVRNRWERA
jgi:hypothetical protein